MWRRRLGGRRWLSVDGVRLHDFCSGAVGIEEIRLTLAIDSKVNLDRTSIFLVVRLGFELRYGDLRFTDEGSKRLTKTIDKRVEKELGTSDAIDARFDSAQIAMMTVASLEDAEKLLKSVSEI